MKHFARHYPESLKLERVFEYLNTDLSMNEIREKYSIKEVNVLRSWMTKTSSSAHQLNDLSLQNLDHARIEISQIIQIYNSPRPYSNVDRLTPTQAHDRQGVLPRHWKNYWKINMNSL